jgi:alcohol dehydrogenase YqhD (iron-dependent ADH family)
MLDTVMEGLMKTVVNYAPIALNTPNDYEARANLMWASSWAINGFVRGGKTHAWSCHPMEHELSAIYDITHGLGLAILTPRWMEYCLDESTAKKFAQFAVNVFGVVKKGSDMDVAKEGISRLSEFLCETLGLDDTFTKVGILEKDFQVMAEKACKGGVIKGFKPLAKEDIAQIFKMCL